MPDEQTAPNTQDAPAQAGKKRGRGKKLTLLFLLVLMLAGGGGSGFYYWRHRAANRARADAALKDTKGADKHSASDSSSDAEIKEVIELQPFIVNLADKNENRYLRMTISLGVGESN